MASVPTGTVTFLFTDIEESTRISQKYPAAWETLRERHNAILRAAIEAHDGYVFEVVGDSLCAAFHRPGDAVNASIKAQNDLQAEAWGEAALRVRMGIHTGVAESYAQGYRGYLALSFVQGLMTIGHGGQILLSQSTFDLIESYLQSEFALLDLGQYQLKGPLQPQHVYQVVAADLPSDFPPLRSALVYPHNLPVQLTSFVGRERELSELRQMIRKARLVTLTGVGGTGKTRLALQLASGLPDLFKDGIWWINLAPLSDPALVPQSIARTLSIHEQPGRPFVDVLKDYLKNKELLILLDNCEHLIETCAQVVEDLLQAAAQVRILATSREALGISGEVNFHVRSLQLPEPSSFSTSIISQSDSVRLFIERAVAVKTDFQLSDDNARTVGEICTRLDGIPLSIELAAARVGSMGVEQIAKRLDNRFRLLTGGSRTALPRQRTLQAAIDWSYQLLSDAERVLLRRLSVFAGSWSLEASELICAGDKIDSSAVLDLLTQLVNKSLVLVDQGTSRYKMLETIREYALNKLDEAGEEELIRNFHLSYYLQLTDAAESGLLSWEFPSWLRQLQRENDNLRAALAWAFARQLPEAACRMTKNLRWFWIEHSMIVEGLSWIDRALALRGVLNDTKLQAQVLDASGEVLLFLPDLNSARQRFEEGLELFRRTGDKKYIAWETMRLGITLTYLGNPEGFSLLEKGVVLARQAGDRFVTSVALMCLGEYWRQIEDDVKAVECYEESLRLVRESGPTFLLTTVLGNLANVVLRQGKAQQAGDLILESLALAQEANMEMDMLYSLVPIAGVAIAQGSYEKAARILGAVAHVLKLFGIDLQPTDKSDLETNIARARAKLGPATFDAIWQEGYSLTLVEAVNYALNQKVR